MLLAALRFAVECVNVLRNHINKAIAFAKVGIAHEGEKEAMKPGRLKIPIHHEHAFAVGCNNHATFARAIVRPVPPLYE